MDEPRTPTDLRPRSWWGVLKRTVRGFGSNNLTDWAAALTYYGVLSLFPGLLVLVSLLGLVGQSATQPLIDTMTQLAPGPARELLTTAISNLQQSQGAGIAAIVGLALALWSASGYIGAFMRASNAVYDVPEGRPLWKTIPIRIVVTVITAVLVAVSVLAVVLTGPVAEQVGRLIGLESFAIRVWDIAKWPVLIGFVIVILALLYRASPNARQSGLRWISPGAVLAVVLWLVASAGFALYVATFGAYNKTYGVLAGVIVFLIWLWISNIAVLLGVEFDAELERGRAIEQGHPVDEEPFVELRDTRAVREDTDPDLG
ncbi:MAG: YihY/virulence factor BrkB family protein [Micromonosporaceae bacterium]